MDGEPSSRVANATFASGDRHVINTSCVPVPASRPAEGRRRGIPVGARPKVSLASVVSRAIGSSVAETRAVRAVLAVLAGEAMAELREDSILFSLKGLLERERERVTDDADREFRRIEAEQLARLERARLVMEERERRRQEEEQQAIREGRRRREATARFDALRRAEIARARAEAETSARMEIEAKQREHELLLLGIREQSGRRRAEQLTMSFGVLALVLIAGGAFAYFGRLQPEHERARVAYEHVVFAEQTRSEEMRWLLEGSERQNRELVQSLNRTRNDLVDAQALAARSDPRRPAVAAAAGRKPIMVPDRPKLRRTCRDDRDPLDGCLP